MALQLGQVEVRPESAVEQLLRVVEEVEAEVEQRRRRPARRRRACGARRDASRAGRTTSVAVSAFSGYSCPSGSGRRSCGAPRRRGCVWPSTTLLQVGESASSRSAMKTLAPELSALMTILRSPGPVISTRRSSRSAGASATRQSPCAGLDPGSLAAQERPRRARRASSSSRRRAPQLALEVGDEGERAPPSRIDLVRGRGDLDAVSAPSSACSGLELRLLGRAAQRERRALAARIAASTPSK